MDLREAKDKYVTLSTDKKRLAIDTGERKKQGKRTFAGINRLIWPNNKDAYFDWSNASDAAQKTVIWVPENILVKVKR